MKFHQLSISTILFVTCIQYVVADPCYYVRWCRAATMRTFQHGEVIPPGFELQNESQIATQGHWYGVVPESYKLRLNFSDQIHYTGAVEVTIKIVESTSRIAINVAKDGSLVALTGIRSRCDPGYEAVDATGCIARITDVKSEQAMILDLRDIELEAGSEWILNFVSIDGQAQSEAEQFSKREPTIYAFEGSPGLQYSTNDGKDWLGNISATSTVFEMRYARSVFPCFDHPVFKAKFDLCIERPATIKVVSNTPSIPEKSELIGSDRRRDCFEQTPPLSAFSLAFALLKNYSSASLKLEDGPLLELFAPNATMDHLHWMLEILQRLPWLNFVGAATSVDYPLNKLTFVVAYPAPNGIVISFGLIIFDGFHMYFSNTSHQILLSALNHQWLGNIMTVAEWREICLQEALSTYLAWIEIAAGRREIFEEFVENALAVMTVYEYHEPFALKQYRHYSDVAAHCYGRPPRFLHTIAKFYGEIIIYQLLKKLFKKKTYGAAGIAVWDRALNEIIARNYSENAMEGYIKGWFLQPGQLHLLAANIPSSDCVIVRQRVLGPFAPSTPIARPVPVKIEIYGSSRQTIPTVLKELEEKICGVGRESFLIDPEGDAVARKAYSARNYRRLFNEMLQNPGFVTKLGLSNTLRDFCTALMENLFPLPEDEPVRVSDWKKISDLFQTLNIRMGPYDDVCYCCLSLVSGSEPSERCDEYSIKHCGDLRLVTLLNTARHDEL